MTKNKIPSTIQALQKIVKAGEGPTLEFKKSTGELKEGLQLESELGSQLGSLNKRVLMSLKNGLLK